MLVLITSQLEVLDIKIESLKSMNLNFSIQFSKESNDLISMESLLDSRNSLLFSAIVFYSGLLQRFLINILKNLMESICFDVSFVLCLELLLLEMLSSLDLQL